MIADNGITTSMDNVAIVIASPHARHDKLEEHLAKLPNVSITRFRDREALTIAALRAIGPRYVFFPHWSWKIPVEIFQHFECIIFHMTDVPFGRGGSPLQNLIVRGIQHTKLTALRCMEEMDAGDVYLKCDLSLNGTAEEILRRASDLTGEMIKVILANNPVPTPQTGEVTLFKRRMPRDGDIAPLPDLGHIYDHIRMLDADGYPRAFVEMGDFRLEFSDAELKPDAVDATVRITRRKP
jgi:methionyl-tRNA formyltransferase